MTPSVKAFEPTVMAFSLPLEFPQPERDEAPKNESAAVPHRARALRRVIVVFMMVLSGGMVRI